MSQAAVAEERDEQLIERFLATRDADAFRTLYRRHSPAVYGLLCRLAGGREDAAADMLQETWIRVAAKLGTFRGNAQFRTWASSVALNCYREWRRASAARPDGLGQEPEEAAAAPAHARTLDVEQILRTMPAHQREVLLLHDVEGFTHEDIAAALGIEPGTSKSRLSRARAYFRSQWEPRGNP